MLYVCLVFLVLASASAAPSGVEVSGVASAEVKSNSNPIISFEKGNVGVNFLGFHASAGLGGLLTGNAADGGLHAEAGTPYGQAAGAGLAGGVDANGKSAGGLYAGATAGGNIEAGAGLSGDTGSSVGTSYAGASLGGIKETHITKTISQPAFVAHKHIEFSSAPVVEHKEVQVQPKKTYIERTVIPNYVEKTIQVPSYVEKTIRVPTVVEKKIVVPAEPTIVEKEVAAPVHANAEAAFAIDTRSDDIGVGKVKVVEKTRIHHHPHHHHFRKHFVFGGGLGGYGNVGANNQASGTYTASLTKHANPQFYQDIFNIPISTLGAVSKLVSGIAGGTSGSLAFSKSYSANY